MVGVQEAGNDCQRYYYIPSLRWHIDVKKGRAARTVIELHKTEHGRECLFRRTTTLIQKMGGPGKLTSGKDKMVVARRD